MHVGPSTPHVFNPGKDAPSLFQEWLLARANRPVARAPPVKPDFATRREHGALAFAANEHADDDTLRVEDV